jgi:hypothetical protein
MAQEPGGAVNLRNPRSGARALFQLLPPQYELNPDGIRSLPRANEAKSGKKTNSDR